MTSTTVNPTPTQGTRTVTITATGTDAYSSVVAGEFFLGTDPGVGNGKAMTVSGTGPWTVTGTLDTSVFPEGTATVKVRTKDAAGNWGAAVNATVTVTAPLSFSTVGTASGRNANNVYRWTGSAMAGGTVYPTAGTGPGNVDGYAVVDATHVYLSFSNTTTNLGGGLTVQDEDVVSYNPTTSTYTLVFDGTANGLNGNGVNVDAVSVADGKLYYSVNGTTRPTGVAAARRSEQRHLPLRRRPVSPGPPPGWSTPRRRRTACRTPTSTG